VDSDRIVRVLGWVVGVRGSSCGSPGLVGAGESFSSCSADRFSSSLVLVVGGDAADRGVEAYRVVLDAHPLQLGGEDLVIGVGL
jgi:hypothetical protein